MSFPITTHKHFRFLFPVLLLALIGMGINTIIVVVNDNWGISSHLPYVLVFCAFMISCFFKQSRIAMANITLFVGYLIIQTRLQTPLMTGTTLLELALITFFFPLSCFACYLFKESVVTIKAAVLYFAILLLFFGVSYLIINYVSQAGLSQWADDILFAIPQVSKLPFVLVLYCIAMVGIAAILVLLYNRAIDMVVYSSVLMAAVTFVFFDVSFISSILFSAAGVLCILSIMSASHDLAFRDSLTQISGRHALNMDLKHLGRTFTIAMVDIDHFKQFNDTYGHDTGDDVLKMVASRLARTQGGARAYRYGGEEFTLIFRGKSAEATKEHLNNIREDIAHYELSLRDANSRPKNKYSGIKQRRAKTAKSKTKSVNVTISIGVADNRTIKEPEGVIKLADDALYSAKKGGRNCVKMKLR